MFPVDIMNSGTAFQKKYLPLDLPFNQSPYGVDSGISPLNDLYPGRPMTIYGRYYEINEIPNEDPEGARETYENSTRETKEYAAYLQKLALAQGGGDKEKVLVHAVDDPSTVINEPSLQGNSVQMPQTQNEGRPFKVPPTVASPNFLKPDIDLEKGDLQQMKGYTDHMDIGGLDIPGDSLVERYEPEASKASKTTPDQSKTKKSADGVWSNVDLVIAFMLLLILVVAIYVACYSKP